MIAALLTLTTNNTYAQIAITTSTNAQSLSQLLAGQGVTISNYTRTCDNNGSGTFTNSGTNLGLSQGVVLATGRVTNVPNAANNFASNQFTNSNDAQLSTLTSGTIYDKCILEFDIIPQGNYLKFDYVFASEEYPEFVCSPYNDVFGFFITGPNPGGGNYNNFNIATIPNTTLPVCINSVNPGNSGTYNGTTWNSGNCVALNQTSFYTNNLTPLNAQIVYDGMTKKLTAIAAVTPCQLYHLKLAIADVGDRIYDSGVFLEAYSFTSAGITVSASGQLDYAGYTSAYEGCVGGTFRVSMPAAQTTNLYVDVLVTGTATNGVDYTTIPTTVMIPAGQTYVNIDLNPLQDGLTESSESVTVAVVNPCTGLPTSSATLMISDNIPLIATAADTTLCSGQSTQLTATGGAAYTWTPSAGLSNANIANPIATPSTTTDYIVSGTWGACIRKDTVTVHVSNLATLLTSYPSDTMCSGSTLQISTNTTGGASPYTYIWSTGSVASNITVATGGAYRVTITDAEGCSVSATKNVYISNPTIAATATNTTCNGNTGTINTTLSGAKLPATYLWNDGNTQANRTGLAAGSYQLTITDGNGCTATTTATVGSNVPTVNVSLATNNVSCFGGNNGSINTTVTGGTSAYSYAWNGGATSANRTGLAAGNYTLTVTDANACSATATAVIAQPAAALAVSLATNNVSCFGGNNGSISTTVTGGTSAYGYAWNGGASTANRTGLAAGIYTLTVTDANLCSATASATITQPEAALAVATSTNNVSCFGGSNGSINTTVTGGTATYSYAWNGGATSANR
ncbi:MAG: choice-of-anchor L domain-containing protein, partial [Bacteroidetes bacterium]|nr:choice-of-anchor L domain-containing protein [Bacteroidota bacterium]